MVNLSNQQFTENEIDLLNNRLRHKIPQKAPLDKIVVNLESSISMMNSDECTRNEIRHKCNNVIEKYDSKIPHPSYKKSQTEMIKMIKDRNVLIMKPDKGKGVVITDNGQR